MGTCLYSMSVSDSLPVTWSPTYDIRFIIYWLYLFVCQAALGEDEDEVPKLPPMFITEFVLDTAQLTFLPDEEEFQDKIAEVIKQFQVYDK